MRAAWINVRRVSQTELQVDGRGYTDQLRNFVVAQKSADIVGGFHIEIDRNLQRRPHGGDLRKSQIRGNVDGIGTQRLQKQSRGRIGWRHHDRSLDVQV